MHIGIETLLYWEEEKLYKKSTYSALQKNSTFCQIPLQNGYF